MFQDYVKLIYQTIFVAVLPLHSAAEVIFKLAHRLRKEALQFCILLSDIERSASSALLKESSKARCKELLLLLTDLLLQLSRLPVDDFIITRRRDKDGEAGVFA